MTSANNPQFPLGGQIWWVSIPNHPNAPHQPRPAIVVSTNSQNKNLDWILVVPTSTSIGANPNPDYHILIPSGEGGLTKNTYARRELITSLDKSFFNRPLFNG